MWHGVAEQLFSTSQWSFGVVLKSDIELGNAIPVLMSILISKNVGINIGKIYIEKL